MEDIYKILFANWNKQSKDIDGMNVGLVPPCSEWQIICELMRNENNPTFQSTNIIKQFEYYIINKLKKEYRFDKDIEIPKIIFDQDNRCILGQYNRETNKIYVSDKFGTQQDFIIRDLCTLAHELRHFAQFNGQRKDELTLNPSPLTKHFNELNVALTLESLTPQEVSEFKSNTSPSVEKKFMERGKQFNLISDRDYYVDETEMDARGFSINLTANFMDFLNDPNLSVQDPNLIDNYQQQFDKVADTEQDTTLSSESFSDTAYESYVKRVEHFQNKLLHDIPDLFEIYQTDCFKMVSLDAEKYYPLIRALTQSLMVNYDDELAHDLLDAFLNAYVSSSFLVEKDYPDILRMLYSTDIELSEQERDKINGILGSRTLNGIDYYKKLAKQNANMQDRLRERNKKQQFDGFLPEMSE